jgi:diguanylate cyclase (GGDEF)-like protein/PAS domain S-box-containing protein
MKKLAAEPKLIACLAAILLMMAMVGVASYSVLSGVNRTFETAVNSTARKLWLAGDINMAAGDMLAAQRGILLYTDAQEVASNVKLFDTRSVQVDRDAAELKSLSINDEELKIIGIVEDSNRLYRKAVHDVIRLDAMNSQDLNEVANAYKSIDEITDKLETLESNRLREALNGTQRRLRYGRIVWRVCVGTASLVVLFALQSIHVMGEALRASAEQARASAHQARASAEQALASAAFSELLMNSMPCAICILDADGNLKRGNKNFLGYSRAEMLEKGVLSMVEPESLGAVKQALAATLDKGYAETEAYLVSKDGTKIPTYLTQTRFVYKGEPCILGVGFDISKQKKAEQYSRLQQVALESASEGIMITDATGKIEWANSAFTTLTGYEVEEVMGVNPRILKSGMMDRAFYQGLWSTILDGQKWSGELWNLNKDGNLYGEEMHIAPVRAMDGRISNFVAVKHDITERKQAEAQAERAKQGLVSLNKELRAANENILRISQTDPLTGLANRRTIDERMHHEMARAGRLGCGFSVILGDLDHFKSINDEFGHLIGDRVLVATAAVLSEQARAYDLPARFGGEEFMVLLPESTLEDALTIAQRIRSAISVVAVPEVTRQITMSLGISTWGQGDTLGTLVGRADAALYQAKMRGRNRVVAQTSDMPPTIEGHMLVRGAGEALAKIA